jgi:hypothetical protein
MNFRLDPNYEEFDALEPFNPPVFSASFTREDFSREYQSACQAVLRELSRVGSVSSYIADGDFSLVAGEDIGRQVGFIANRPEAPSPAYVPAAQAALQSLPVEYIIIFEAEPAYVCVRRDGTVLGYCVDGSPEPLAAFGFPADTA